MRSISRVGRGLRNRAFGVAAAAVMTITGASHAQFAPGRFMGEDPFSPAFSARQIEGYAAILGMNEEQLEVARVLFDGYLQGFQAESGQARQRVRRAMDEAREFRDRERWREVMELRVSFGARATELEREFLEDLRSILEPTQLERWEVVERVRRRERTIGRGLMSGERVDLVEMVSAMDLPEGRDAEIHDIIERYQIDLDRELIRRNRVYDDAQAQMMRLGGAMPDLTTLEEMAQRGREASRRVRDVNERYARQVAALLDGDAREAFERRVREASFPEIYRTGRTTRVIESAAGLNDLTDDQATRLATLARAYDRDAEALNARLAASLRDMEENFSVADAMRGGMRGGGPMAQLWQERRDLERRYNDRLREILSPEQFDRLPPARANDGPPQWQQRGPQRGAGQGARPGGRRGEV